MEASPNRFAKPPPSKCFQRPHLCLASYALGKPSLQLRRCNEFIRIAGNCLAESSIILKLSQELFQRLYSLTPIRLDSEAQLVSGAVGYEGSNLCNGFAFLEIVAGIAERQTLGELPASADQVLDRDAEACGFHNDLGKPCIRPFGMGDSVEIS